MAQKFLSRLSLIFSWAEVRRVFSRFPLSVSSSLLFMAVATLSAYQESYNPHPVALLINPTLMPALNATFFIGIVLFTGFALLGEGMARAGWKKLLIQFFAAVPLYFFVFCPAWNEHNMNLFFPLVFLSGLLLMIAGPFVLFKKDSTLPLWRWMMNGLACATQGLSSGVLLMIGAGLAFTSIAMLFDVTIPEWVIVGVLAFLGAVMSNWIFLSRLPDNAHQAPDFSPEPLLFLAKMVALPILGTFELILLAYLFRILVTGVWPSGAVALPVLVYSIVGFVALHALSPLRQESRGVAFAARWIPLAILFFMVVYFMGLSERISAYGITELRYLGVLLGLLLTGWSLAWVLAEHFKRPLRLELLPLVGSGLIFLVSFGPWGFEALTTSQQMERLRHQLEGMGILRDGELHTLDESLSSQISDDAVLELESQLHYLHWRKWNSRTQTSGFNRDFKDYFSADFGLDPEAFFATYGLDQKIMQIHSTSSDLSQSIQAPEFARPIPAGAQQIRPVYFGSYFHDRINQSDPFSQELALSPSESVFLSFLPETQRLLLEFKKEGRTTRTTTLDLQPLLNRLSTLSPNAHFTDWDLLTLEGEGLWIQLSTLDLTWTNLEEKAAMQVSQLNFQGQLYLRD